MTTTFPPIPTFRIKTSEYNTSNLRDLASALSQAFTSICSSGAAIGVLAVNQLNVNQLNVTGAVIGNLTGTNANFTNLTGGSVNTTNAIFTNLTVTNVMTGNIVFSSQNQLDDGHGNVVLNGTGTTALQINIPKLVNANNIVLKNLSTGASNTLAIMLQANPASNSKSNWSFGTDFAQRNNQDFWINQNFFGNLLHLGYNVVGNFYTGATGAFSSLNNVLDDGRGTINFVGGLIGPVISTGTFTAGSNSFALFLTGSSTVTLPLANGSSGQIYKIINSSATANNILTTTPNVFNGTGSGTLAVNPKNAVSLLSDGQTSWWVV
jgi:hypothetical protein